MDRRNLPIAPQDHPPGARIANAQRIQRRPRRPQDAVVGRHVKSVDKSALYPKTILLLVMSAVLMFSMSAYVSLCELQQDAAVFIYSNSSDTNIKMYLNNARQSMFSNLQTYTYWNMARFSCLVYIASNKNDNSQVVVKKSAILHMLEVGSYLTSIFLSVGSFIVGILLKFAFSLMSPSDQDHLHKHGFSYLLSMSVYILVEWFFEILLAIQLHNYQKTLAQFTIRVPLRSSAVGQTGLVVIIYYCYVFMIF